MTAVDLMTTMTVSPSARPRLSALLRVMTESKFLAADVDRALGHDAAELDRFGGARELVACAEVHDLLRFQFQCPALESFMHPGHESGSDSALDHYGGGFDYCGHFHPVPKTKLVERLASDDRHDADWLGDVDLDLSDQAVELDVSDDASETVARA
jgi:hypothetical protein